MDDLQAAEVAFTSYIAAALAGSSTLSDGHRTLAWADVPDALAALDAFFDEQGIAPHEPVALECANSVPGALALLALLQRGATVVLLPHPGRAEVSASSAPLPLFLTRRLRVRPAGSDGDAGALRSPAVFLESRSLPCSRPLPAESPLRRHHLILRTSGSVADPKWVVHTHAGVLLNARNAVQRLALARTDRVLIPVPLAHMYGLGAGFLPALAAGASIELLDGANVIRYLERERVFQPTVAFLTPNLCSMLLRPRSAPEHYRHIVVAGDKLAAAAFEQAEAIYRRVVNLYGSTELGVICAGDAREPTASAALTVGRPLPGVWLRLERSLDEIGELVCAHPHGFTGYLELDGTPVPRDPAWHATHDLARLREDGTVELLGRSDHATKRDGRLVMISEVEHALARLPGVAGAAIVLGEPTLRGRALVAFVSPEPGTELDVARLRRDAAERLPSYAVPDELRVIAALPLLPSGKLDRRRLHT